MEAMNGTDRKFRFHFSNISKKFHITDSGNITMSMMSSKMHVPHQNMKYKKLMHRYGINHKLN